MQHQIADRNQTYMVDPFVRLIRTCGARQERESGESGPRTTTHTHSEYGG
jgi:hypothetical protein